MLKKLKIYEKIGKKDINFEGVIFGILDYPISKMYDTNLKLYIS